MKSRIQPRLYEAGRWGSERKRLRASLFRRGPWPGRPPVGADAAAVKDVGKTGGTFITSTSWKCTNE